MLMVWAAVCLTAYLIWFFRLVANLSGPRVWPVVGSLPGLIRNKNRLHEWIADSLCSSGGTYQTCVCAVPLLARRQGLVTVTCDPRNLEHILKTRFNNYPKGPGWHAVFSDLLGDGIFNSDGDTWMYQRKTAAPEFSTRTLRAAMSRWVSHSINDRLLPILDAAAADESSSVDLQDLLLRLNFDDICGLTFGRNPETLATSAANGFAAAFDRATEATLQRLILPAALWNLKKWFRLGTESSLPSSVFLVKLHLRTVIKMRKLELSASHDDLLSRFLRASPPPSDDFLCDLGLNFILAGRDTSSVALSWFFWLVSTHPAVELSLLRELRSTAHPLTFDELDRLVYLKAALSEALRLYPSVPEDTKHVAADDVLPDGTFLPRGSSVTYSIYSVGRMKSVWGQDCLRFKPERWISPDGSRFEPPADPFKFMAFNAGPRLCLGKDLAYLQMKSIAVAVIPRYRFDVEPGHRVEQKMSLTLFMKHGLRVRVRRRLESELT